MIRLLLLPLLASAATKNSTNSTSVTTMYSKFFLNPVPTNGTFVQSSPYSPTYTTASPLLRVGPVARGNNNYNAASLPCCRDRFGEAVCQSLSKSQPDLFERRCLTDHDFHTLDCCAECRAYIDHHKIQPENARSLFKAPSMCKDKHSLTFCRRFKSAGMGKFSCATAEFAVRVCRHTCGYCNDHLYSASNVAPLCAKSGEKRKTN